MTVPESKKTLYCSFCGKLQHEVHKFIAGPTTLICNECILLCVDICRDEGVPGFVVPGVTNSPAVRILPAEVLIALVSPQPGQTAVEWLKQLRDPDILERMAGEYVNRRRQELEAKLRELGRARESAVAELAALAAASSTKS